MTDAHCHPLDLLEYDGSAEEKRRESGTACAANSWNREEFLYIDLLAERARKDGAPPMFRCFALHPQLSASFLKEERARVRENGDFSLEEGLELLASYAGKGRLEAVGETGFDLYNETFRAAEKIQDTLFAFHLEIALKHGLPLVLHARRAMHKIFPFTKNLKKLPSVIFHSWPGTAGEGEALLRRGVNAFFSFGAAILNQHRRAMEAAARFPPERILLETDAPFQPPRGKTFSSWIDLPAIIRAIAALRKEAGDSAASPEELETRTTANFYRAFQVH